MDSSILKKGIARRRDWIRRNPGSAGDYIRLSKTDRERVDQLFLASRKLKANEVTDLVERLTTTRLERRRISTLRNKALSNMRAQLGDSEKFNDSTVSRNVSEKMSARQIKVAASADVDQLIALASAQAESNPFWYH